MRERLLTRAANAAWLAGCLPARLSFESALKDPGRAQRAVLQRLLAANAGTAFGRRHGLESARSAREFQDAVPARGYDALRPWIERALNGEPGVLTSEPVLMFEKTSGSAAAAKYIPYTASLRREFQRALGAWISDLFLSRPALLAGRSYWCVTPLARAKECTRGGLPVGFESDAEYLGAFQRRLARAAMAVPCAAAQAPDLEAGLYVTLRFLLQAEDLALISLWNPSFGAVLLGALRRHAPALLADLSEGVLRPPTPLPAALAASLRGRLTADPARAARLSRALGRDGFLKPAAVWPKLALVSCWGDASAKQALPGLRGGLPGVEIQPKGLLATEGVVTIPRMGLAGGLPALTSHFLEFVEAPGSRPRLADELERGGRYSVLMTTGGGLWRYDLGDTVRVVGFHGRAPLLEFEGRRDDVCDLTGEKLHAAFVGEALEALQAEGLWAGDFAMLAPASGVVGYRLFVEGRAAVGLAARLDRRLSANPHYEYARAVGQLAPPSVALVRGALEAFVRRGERSGQRAGAVKPAALDRRAGWEDWFAGAARRVSA